MTCPINPEHGRVYDFFRGKNIVPDWETDLPVEYRKGTENASRIGKALSAVIPTDPRYVDHVISQQLGPLGGLALKTSDIGKGQLGPWVGSVIPNSPSYFDLTLLGAADRKKIVEDEHGAGEILACIFNASGQPGALEYNRRVVGLCLKDLRAIPLTIGVAATEQKILPILGALRGRYLKTIITDEAAALGVLDLYIE